jgi:ribosomal protein S27E
MRSRCPECGARFSSAFAVECEACGGALRPAEAFGGPIRKPGR